MITLRRGALALAVLLAPACGGAQAESAAEPEAQPVEPAAEPAPGPDTAAAPEVTSEIPCESDDDCWIEGGRPIARPASRRGERFEPCSNGEEIAPVCFEGRCGGVAFGC